MVLCRQLDDYGGVLDPYVEELIALPKSIQEYLGRSAEAHRYVDADVDRLRVPDLTIVVVYELVQSIADWLHHVVIINGRLVAVVEVDEQELQGFRQRRAFPGPRRRILHGRLPCPEIGLVLRLMRHGGTGN